jgi:hypothetical protein
MSTLKLTPTAVALAVEQVKLLVLTGDTRTAALLEHDIVTRFIEATAQGRCTDPVEAAAHLHALKALAFPRTHPKACSCTKHRLDAIFGPSPSAGAE